jgi:energy-coupling factor transport system substrate-specific component
MRFFSRYSSEDLLYIAIFSALGLAIKPIVTPLVHLVSAPLMIPGGSLAGGFYMMWLALAIAVVNKTGTGLLVGFVQAVVMISLGYFGNHGAVSLLSYTLPGIAADAMALFFRNRAALTAQAVICLTANISGTMVVTLLVMRLTAIPLLISIIAASISGILGGILSYAVFRRLKRFRII